MKPEAQRIAIAEACGFTEIHDKEYYYDDWNDGGFITEPFGLKNGDDVKIPNYPNDLNAMYEALATLTKEQWLEYPRTLLLILWRYDVTGHPYGVNIDHSDHGWWKITTWEMQMLSVATAAQCAEAFLRTIGKWEDDL